MRFSVKLAPFWTSTSAPQGQGSPASAHKSALVAAAVVALLAGCSPSTHHHAATPTTAAAAPSTHHPRASPTAAAAAPSARRFCRKLITWRNNNGGARITAVTKDLRATIHAASTGSLTATQGAVAKLSADAQTALRNPPPACAPQMRTKYTAAMHDFLAAAKSINQGTMSSVQNAMKQLPSGSAALVRAVRDLRRFEGTSQKGRARGRTR